MLLTVEQREAGTEKAMIELYADSDGLDFLIQKLQQLQQHGGHDHLMTPAWAGHELSETPQGDETTLINHLCIVLCDEQAIIPSDQLNPIAFRVSDVQTMP